LKIPPAINQFSRTLDKNTATELFKLMAKYKPESKASKKARLLRLASAQLKAREREKQRLRLKKKQIKEQKLNKKLAKAGQPKKAAKEASAKEGKAAKPTKPAAAAPKKDEKAAEPASPKTAKPASAKPAKPAAAKKEEGKAAKPAKPAKPSAAGKKDAADKKKVARKVGGKIVKKKVERKKPSGPKKPHVLKYGINHITALIEQKKARLVIIANDVDPVELVVWLPALCRKMQVPYCIVKNKARLGNFVGKKTATALALTNVNNEDRDRLTTLSTAIKENYNDRFEEFRKQWGGGRLGAKSTHSLAKKNRKIQKENRI